MIRHDFVIPQPFLRQLEIAGGLAKVEKGSQVRNETWASTESVRGSGLTGWRSKAVEAVPHQMRHLLKIRGQQQVHSRQGSGQPTSGINNRDLEVTLASHWRLSSLSVRVGTNPRRRGLPLPVVFSVCSEGTP